MIIKYSAQYVKKQYTNILMLQQNKKELVNIYGFHAAILKAKYFCTSSTYFYTNITKLEPKC